MPARSRGSSVGISGECCENKNLLVPDALVQSACGFVASASLALSELTSCERSFFLGQCVKWPSQPSLSLRCLLLAGRGDSNTKDLKSKLNPVEAQG